MGLQQRQVGAGIVVKINGNVVGFATDIQYNRQLGVKTIYGIDSPFIREIGITGPYQVTGTLSGFRLRDSGGLEGQAIMNASNVDDYFQQKYVSMEIIDILSGAAIGLISQALFISDSWTINARNPVTFNAQFIGVFITNELSDNK